MDTWSSSYTVLLCLNLILTAIVIIAFFPIIKSVTRKIFLYHRWLYENIAEPVTLENFRDGFNTNFSRKKAAIDIFDAIESGHLVIPDLDTDKGKRKKQIGQLCKDHLNQIMKAYEESFKRGYWKTYASTKAGYHDFLRVASTLNTLPEECITTIRYAFCRTLYALDPKKLTEETCGFLDWEIQLWCLRPQSGPGRKLPKDIP